MVDVNQVHNWFLPLWADVQDPEDYPNTRPLLAHYTSLSTFESMVKSGELWLSNPLFMNDSEELRFGLLEADRAFRAHPSILEACGGEGPRYEALLDAFSAAMQAQQNEHAFDTYIACFSRHAPSDNNGRLSMWRGYGADGHGVAIVFDTKRIQEKNTSPLVLARVHYASRDERLAWIDAKLRQFAALLGQHDIPTEAFYVPVHTLVMRLQLFAIFSKNDGFREEDEWRLVYVKDRDRDGNFNTMFGYQIRGDVIEPKLKLKVEALSGVQHEGTTLHDLVERIIVGPSGSSPLAIASLQRMLQIIGRPELGRLLRSSETPYRPKG